MASKTAKLAAVPAALGFATVRVYALSESKAEDLRSPHELSVYTAPTSPSRFVEENPGLLQRGLGVVRVGVLPYVRAIKNACVSVKIGSVNLYHAGEDAYDFLRDPPPGFLPRISFITVCGLAGLVLARKGTRLKRVGVSLGLATVGAGVCYPVQTVTALKVSGKQVYKATQWASSSVTSLWKPSPAKKVTAPSAGPEAVPAPGPDSAAPVKPAPESESPPPPAEDPTPSAAAEGTSPVLPTDAGSTPVETPTDPASGEAVVPPPAESASPEERAPLPALEAPPGPLLDHSPDPAPPELSVDPLSEQIAPAADALGIPVSAAHPVEETASVAPPPVEDATPVAPPPVEDTTPVAPPPVEDTTPVVPDPVEDTTPVAPPAVEDTTPVAPPPAEETAPLAPPPVEDTAPVAPFPAEETVHVAPPSVEDSTPVAPPPVEELAPLLSASDPAPASAPVEPPACSQPAADPASSEPAAEVPEKPRFAPDPKLLDHGQSSPEDSDLYSTRS